MLALILLNFSIDAIVMSKLTHFCSKMFRKMKLIETDFETYTIVNRFVQLFTSYSFGDMVMIWFVCFGHSSSH